MKWLKAPEELKNLIEKLMAPIQSEKRPMFGYPAFFINRNMFAGLFQDKVFVRLSPDQLSSLRSTFPGIHSLEPMPGRPMKDYTEIPKELYKDAGKMGKLLQEAAAWCRTLPEKPSKRKKTAKEAPAKRSPSR